MRTAPVVAVLGPLLNLSVACAADVSINGTVVPKATSTVEATQDTTEFRSGGDPAISLLPGSKRYTVCVIAPAPVAVLDACGART